MLTLTSSREFSEVPLNKTTTLTRPTRAVSTQSASVRAFSIGRGAPLRGALSDRTNTLAYQHAIKVRKQERESLPSPHSYRATTRSAHPHPPPATPRTCALTTRATRTNEADNTHHSRVSSPPSIRHRRRRRCSTMSDGAMAASHDHPPARASLTINHTPRAIRSHQPRIPRAVIIATSASSQMLDYERRRHDRLPRPPPGARIINNQSHTPRDLIPPTAHTAGSHHSDIEIASTTARSHLPHPRAIPTVMNATKIMLDSVDYFTILYGGISVIFVNNPPRCSAGDH